MAINFSSALIGALAEPDFGGEGLMRTFSEAVAAPERREEERKSRAAEQTTIQTLREGLFSSDQGDVNALNEKTKQLMDLLPTIRDENTREMITDGINRLTGLRNVTQDKATTNTANAIIQTERALQEITERQATVSGPPSDEDELVRQTLEKRLGVMRQNAKAVTQAEDIRYNTKLQGYQRENQIYNQQAEVVERELYKAGYGSEEYKAAAESARKNGFGKVVDKIEKTQIDLMKARDEAAEIRNKTAPLTPAEKQELKDRGIQVPDDVKLARKIYGDYYESRATRQIVMANRDIQGIPEPMPVIKTTLERLQERGDLPGNFISDDLYNKIEDLLDDPDELDLLNDLLTAPEGEEYSRAEVEQRVVDYVKDKFPEQFKDMETYRNEQAEDQALLISARNDLLVKAGVAKVVDGNIDLSGVSAEDMAKATMAAERKLDERNNPPPPPKASTNKRFARPRGGAGMAEIDASQAQNQQQFRGMLTGIGERLEQSRQEEREALRSGGRIM
jgi:hypothetical protein